DDDAGVEDAGETDTPPDAPPDLLPDAPPDAVDGEAEMWPPSCGPWPGGACPTGFVCDVRSCLDGASGTCVPDPGGACPSIYAPVCGCDGVTYGNNCMRLSAGAALDHEGECGGTRCGGMGGLLCDPGYVCDLHDCALDAVGTCVARPSDCLDVWDPVCGCDGVTYGNDCDRLTAGVALDYVGECGGTSCVPICERTGTGRTAWVDGCTGVAYCNARCDGCTAECRFVGTRSEGWYAACPSVVGAGCDASTPDLIAYADCG
ncbi:MAG: hypothetical protein JXB32_15625, partial [Deltaproteobacteria bacterium]|nr:hypothetical protein [Deltaproteobacteria bacterium]